MKNFVFNADSIKNDFNFYLTHPIDAGFRIPFNS